MQCHKIVYLTFRKNKFSGYEIDHGNRIHDDARECNLRPATMYMQKDNCVRGSNRDDENYDSDEDASV